MAGITLYEGNPSQYQEVSAFFEALARRFRLFAAIVAGFVLLVGAVTFFTPKSYTTTARVIAGNPTSQGSEANNTTLPILNALVLQSGVESAETFATLAQQEDVAASVARSMHLNVTPRALLSSLTVTPTTNTAILNLAVTWRDADTSAKLANAFADAFMRKERDFVRSQATTAIGFLSTELPRAQSRAQKTANDLARFQAANGFVDAGSHTQDVVSKATSLESKIDQLTLDSREATALLNNANAQLASLSPTINNAQQISVNPVLTDLQTKLEQIDLQLSQAQSQYTDQHPLVTSLKKQRADLVARIARVPAQIDSQNTLSPNPVYQSLQQQIVQYRQRIDGDTAQLGLLRKQRANMAPMLLQLPTQSMQFATLQQQAKLASDVYNALEQKYNDATIAQTTAISDISIVQSATADSAIVKPNLKINLLAALLVGLVLGSIAVFALELLARPVRENSGARMLGLSVIGRIPMFAATNQRMLPWLQSMTLEAFLQLCVSLKLKNKAPMRTLAVTSPSRGDGKSTIAFNLAKAMSNLEPRILLIDADLRRPTLHDLAGASNKHGVTSILHAHMHLSHAVQSLSSTLDLLAAGPSVDNPVASIQSPAFDELIREASERYDMVIVDTPALACVTDGYLVTAKTDATVVVVAANSTPERETQEVLARFAALGIDNLVGVVLNRDRKRVNDYSDYFARLVQDRALPGSSAS
ncbi:MAG TPA: polysaccharide biosynthesis tyrosine autokinase [Candidatus Baltobacteraceae bacterium]|nr:polysaccharide biosynthesis tyrosine autokinase [Candidatus Baltobacteraceae bacterium]